jgi:signal transduction histidine kinase
VKHHSRSWPYAESELHFASALAEAAAVVNSSLDFDQVLDRILEQVSRVVPGDTYNIMLAEDGVGRIVRWRGYDNLGIPETTIAATRTPVNAYATFQEMIQSGNPMVVPDTLTDETWIVKPHRVDHRAYVGTPIRIVKKTVGFINVNSSHSGQFTRQDARRLSAFADHAAIALQNADLFQQARQHTEELEQRVAARTQALQARTAWSEAILRSTSDGIIVADMAGGIIQTNPIADQWLTQNLQPVDEARLRGAIRSLAQQAKKLPKQLIELTGVDLELTASPIEGATDAQGAVVIALHDVTHLRAIDRMKSQFISDVSHELRTPIAAMRLYASLIHSSPAERRDSYVTSLEQELDRITRLVEGILQIARLEAGRFELNVQEVDLNLLVTTATNSYTDSASQKGLTIRADICPQPITISGDPVWLIHALNNLIENALQYTDAGTVTLTTDTVTVDGRALARLRIQDTGIGIPDAELPHIFERFFRGDEVRARQIPGSGLGLSIVRSILNAHGGMIQVASEGGQGTTVTVFLPLAHKPDWGILK